MAEREASPTLGGLTLKQWIAAGVIAFLVAAWAFAGGETESPAFDAEQRSAGFKWVASGGDIQTFTIAPGETREQLAAAAKAACEEHRFCQVYGWAREADQAKAWPMLEREASVVAIRYAINRLTGYEDLQYFCGSPGAKADCARYSAAAE